MLRTKSIDVSTLKLKDVNLSSVAEEDTCIMNPEVFMTTDSYWKMLDDTGVLVVGRKGAGKTAIRIGLKKFAGIQYDMWIELGLKRIDFSRFRNLLRDVLPEYPDGLDLLLQNTWRMTIVCAMMAKARNHEMLNKRAPKLKTMIDQYFAQYSLTDETDFFKFIPDQVLSRVMSRTNIPDDFGRRNLFPIEEKFLEIEKYLMSALGAGLGAVVTIDNLDDCIVTEYYHETVVPTTEALIKASKELISLYGKSGNEVIRTEERKLRIKCFVPQDIFSSIDYRHTDKLANNSTTIHWTSAALREMLARHLAPYLSGAFKQNPESNAERIIMSVFGSRIVGYWGVDNPFHFLICHSLLRPRDVLFFTSEIFKRTCHSNNEASSVPENLFFHYLHSVTQDYSSNIIREYQGKWPHLKEAVDLLHGEKALLSIEYLKNKWFRTHKLHSEEAWENTVQSLFDAGVIGYETFVKRLDFDNRVKKIKFSFACKQKERAPMKGNIAVHPLFWAAYAIEPVKYRIEIP